MRERVDFEPEAGGSMPREKGKYLSISFILIAVLLNPRTAAAQSKPVDLAQVVAVGGSKKGTDSGQAGVRGGKRVFMTPAGT